MNEEIKNIVRSTYVESNLVYPLDKGYYYVARLEEKWVKTMLRVNFGRDTQDIHNKYAVAIITSTGNTILVTNHDGKYWLTEKP